MCGLARGAPGSGTGDPVKEVSPATPSLSPNPSWESEDSSFLAEACLPTSLCPPALRSGSSPCPSLSQLPAFLLLILIQTLGNLFRVRLSHRARAHVCFTGAASPFLAMEGSVQSRHQSQHLAGDTCDLGRGLGSKVYSRQHRAESARPQAQCQPFWGK